MNAIGPRPALDTAASSSTTNLIVELARALHTHGVAAYELEDSMAEVATVLGVSAQFFATPTALWVAFEEEGGQRTHFIRIEPGAIDLDKLSRLYVLQNAVLAGSVSVEEGLRRTKRIAGTPPRYGGGLRVAAFGIGSGTAAAFFGGAGQEMGAAAAIGVVIGLLSLILSGSRAAQRLFLPASSLVATVLAFGLGVIAPTVSAEVVTVSSLIILIPGLSLTVALNELATNNLASGSARIAGAAAQFLILGFGVALGRSLVALVAELPRSAAPETLPVALLLAALLAASIAFTILFQARPEDTGWIVAAGFIAYFGAKVGVELLGPEAGASLAALVLAAASNGLSRIRKQPASVTLVPGLLLLVPGSLGFRSVSALLDHDVLRTVESASQMGLVAASIVGGLLLANLLIPRRKHQDA